MVGLEHPVSCTFCFIFPSLTRWLKIICTLSFTESIRHYSQLFFQFIPVSRQFGIIVSHVLFPSCFDLPLLCFLGFQLSVIPLRVNRVPRCLKY